MTASASAKTKSRPTNWTPAVTRPATGPPATAEPAASPVAPNPLDEVLMVGNVVFPADYYRAALAETGFNRRPFQTRAAARRLQKLLRRQGYGLAEVRPAVRGGQPVLIIDEGRLAKIVFIGGGSVRTLQLQLTVSMPHDVFNKEILTTQLDAIQHDLGIRCQYKVQRVVRQHDGVQLDLFDENLPPQFELHIRLSQSAWNTGVGVHVTINGADGLRLGLSYGNRDLVLDRDAWRARVDIGGKLFNETSQTPMSLGLARSVVDLRWFTPPIAGDHLRTFLWTYGDFLVRQRPLEYVDFYRWFRAGVLANLAYDWREGQMVALGFGGEHRALADIEQPSDPPREFPTFSEWRLIGVAQTEMVFDPNEIRRDRHHLLSAEARTFRNAGGRNQLAFEYKYQNVWELGWHDLWLRSHGVALAGPYPIMDEEPVNRCARGVFATDFSARMASLSSEFRFSLMRDKVKLAGYLDLVVFEPTRFGHASPPARGAFAAGLGANALLLDTVQADIYYGLGVLTDRRLDHGVALRLTKAY